MQANPHRLEEEAPERTGKPKGKKKKPYGLVLHSSIFNRAYSYKQWYKTEKARDEAFKKYDNEYWGGWNRKSEKRYNKIEKIER